MSRLWMRHFLWPGVFPEIAESLDNDYRRTQEMEAAAEVDDIIGMLIPGSDPDHHLTDQLPKLPDSVWVKAIHHSNEYTHMQGMNLQNIKILKKYVMYHKTEDWEDMEQWKRDPRGMNPLAVVEFETDADTEPLQECIEIGEIDQACVKILSAA